MNKLPDPYFDDYPDVDRKSCQLLGPTALVVQGLMGILVVSSLVYKRHRETPKRPWRIWLFDVWKQIIGQMFVHGVNVLISDVVAHVSAGNACVLYFLNILIDTTLGVAIIYFFLHLITYFFTEKCRFKGFESGQYGSPPSIIYWLRQATVYVFSLTSMKLLVVVLFALWPGIFTMGEWMLSFLGSSEQAQVIFTMGIFPICMNIVQFWLIDSIVKARTNTDDELPTSDPSRPSYDREPLFRASSDDEEDDDDDDLRPHDIENPPLLSPSLSRSRGQSPTIPNESKLSLQTQTASGSATPSPKVVDLIGSQSIAMHAYPPVGSTSTSPVSPFSLHSPDSSMSLNSSNRRRRSPPPPLTLSPRAGFPAVVVTSQIGQSVPQEKSVIDTLVQDEKSEWDAWGDDATDDWADKVGEEEWTGKRIGSKMDSLHDVWSTHEEFRPTAIRAG